MKKFISAVISAAMIFTTVISGAAHAESYGEGVNIMILGDSIASGYGLSKTENNYGQLVAEYLGGSVENYAKSGYGSAETLAQIRGFDSTQREQLAQTDIVILSTGANDMIKYAASSLLEFAEGAGLLEEGKTAADFPQNPTLDTVKEFIDGDAMRSYADNFQNAMNISDRLDNIYQHITYTDANTNGANRTQVIAKQIIPNIEAMVSEIKAVNPDARIILQTVYNPLQFEKTYEDELKASFSSSYNLAFVKLKTVFNMVTKRYSEQISAVDGVEIADVLTDFTSLYVDDDSIEHRYGWYFTDLQAGEENADIHPNQAGHVAIAVSILNTIDDINKVGGLLEQTYMNLPDVKNYPEYALAQYEKVALAAPAIPLGDIDNDGKVDSADASLALIEYARISTGQPSGLSAEQLTAADVNRDGKIDSTDASTILQFYTYISTGGIIKDMGEWLGY